MNALDRKALRDLALLKGQAVSIALVVACGIAGLVASLSAYGSLRNAQQLYYSQTRFADVFALVKRAPEGVLNEIALLPGVSEAEARVEGEVLLDIPGLLEPASARLVAIDPAGGRLNRLVLRQGSLLGPGRSDEVLVSEAFAIANGFKPGDTIAAVLDGKRQRFRIAGIALSPEFVYYIRPGSVLPDDMRSGVLWASRAAVAAALGMEGAFNSVALRLTPDANEAAVIEDLDRVLRPYGGFGAHGRKQQMSNRFVEDELGQQRVMATGLPVIFLAVAAFLLNMVVGRLVSSQREQIGVLKAVGYSNTTVIVHYVKIIVGIIIAGVVLGLALGAWVGHWEMQLYTQFFRFPALPYRLEPGLAVMALAVSLAAGLSAAWGAVRFVSALPPAVAMRPPAPQVYQRTLIDKLGMLRWLSPEGRMIVRSLARRPVRAMLTGVGIGLSAAIIVAGYFFFGSMNHMVHVQFGLVDRSDAMVSFNTPVGEHALVNLASFPGVERVEGSRALAVRIRAGHRDYATALLGIDPADRLMRPLDADLRPIVPQPGGMAMSSALAERLGVATGDFVRVEGLEGRRPAAQFEIVAVTEDLMGMSAYVDEATLRSFAGDGNLFTHAYLQIDRSKAERLYERIKQLPFVAAFSSKALLLGAFHKYVEDFTLGFVFFLVGFSLVISVGVVYNSMRMSLAERGWELASLRILGFTRGEVTRTLLGESGVQIMLSFPLGCLLGYGLAALTIAQMPIESVHIPFIVSPSSYGLAAVALLLAGMLSGLLVARRIRSLDLVSVLKARE